MAENYVSRNKVKKMIKAAGLKSAKDVTPALNEAVEVLLQEAIKLVKAEERTVIHGVDVTGKCISEAEPTPAPEPTVTESPKV